VLQGEKQLPTVIKGLTASGICSSLTSLVFDDVYGSKKLHKEDAVPNLLKLCPNLEELVAPPSLMQDRNLSFHISALSDAREGAPILLKVLDLSDRACWGGWRALNWSILSKMGAQLPCLEVFKLIELSSDTPVQMDPTILLLWDSPRHLRSFPSVLLKLSRQCPTSKSFRWAELFLSGTWPMSLLHNMS